MVLFLAIAGPYISEKDKFPQAFFSSWGRQDWLVNSLYFAVILIILFGSTISRTALFLAVLPLAYAYITDKTLINATKSPDKKLKAESVSGLDFDKLWIYFQQGGAEIWNADETVYLGTFEGDPGECIIEINGPDEYPVPYCKSRTDLPRIVNDFVEYGGSLTDLARVIEDSPSQHVGNLNNQNQPLTGPELLAKIKELGDVPKSDLVRACGYSSPKDGGGERLNFTGFYEALLTAKGVAMSTNNADSDESSEEENIDQKDTDLPADWQELEGEQLVSKLRDSEQVDIDVLRVLASFDDWTVRQAVAWHDSTPDDVLKILTNDDDSDVSNATRDRDLPKSWRFMSRDDKIEALKADDVSSEIIELLASSEDWRMRQAVAWSPSTQEPILEKLREDEDEDVQVAVTTDRRLPVDWRFMIGSWDLEEHVREESTELAILEVLVQSRDSAVRRAVALHPNTTESLLDMLREDSDDSVQSGLRERDLPDSWKMRDEDERVLVLKTDEVPASVVTILSKSHSWRIRQAVALSTGTPQAILDELVNDSDQDVQSAVRERALPDEWKILDDDGKVERLNEQEAPVQVLDILSRSGQWSIRQAVASNPGTSEDILKSMIENDSDDDVVKAAKKALRKIVGNSGDNQNSGPLTYYFGIYEGNSNSGSCYLAELQATEQGDHDVDDGEITEELREELEEGCIGWGPFKDQKLIVWTEEDGDEDIIAVVDIEEAIDSDKVHDCHVCLGYGTKGKHIIGVHTEKGGFNGEAELDIEDFDEDKITFGLVNLADNWFIINSVQYDGEEIEMEGDSTGKGSEYYKFEDDETEYIC